MPPLRHILFPYDFSPQGQQIAPFVKALACRFAARVTVLGVVPPTFDPVPAGIGPQIRMGDDVEQWRRALQDQLDGALAADLEGVAVDRVAVCGDPALRIVDVANSAQIDLIMMPTHGLGIFRRMLLGSVTSKVLHDARCPVWTAAHAEAQRSPVVPRTVLCAVDATVAAPALMQWAATFTSALGARLQLLHVVDPITDWPSLESEQRRQEQVREMARERFVSVMKSAAVDVPYRVAVGELVPTLSEQAREEQADLVIIGRGSMSEDFGRLRTHTFGIIQRVLCPVLSV